MRNIQTVRVEIAGEVLESVFDECDRYDLEETGGRVVGHFTVKGEILVIQAIGVIEPGPKTRRTRTSLFQDGEYQTEVFRLIETECPSIEHLGNWHTHHMNGYPSLSRGDKRTYRRIVNHELHNLDFFYALLVTHRNDGQGGLDRYAVRHYVLFRGDNTVHEIDQNDVTVTNQSKIWPAKHPAPNNTRKADRLEGDGTQGMAAVRARDLLVLGVLFPSLEPRLSTQTGIFFWKGDISLIDGSAINVKIAEIEDNDTLCYFPVVAQTDEDAVELRETAFPSAAHAARALELRMNKTILEAATTR